MRFLLGIFAFLLLLGAGYACYSFYLYRTPSVAAETTILIGRGTGTRTMLAQLAEQQVLPAPWKIALPIALSGNLRDFKAGEYKLSPGMSPQLVLQSIVRGEVIVHAVTVPEGWNVAEVRAALVKEPLLTGDVPADIPEGSLATDTVYFRRGDTRAEIVARLQKQQQERLFDAWNARDNTLPYNSPDEALVMASIVESETGVTEERAHVASVYLNRLKLNMPLQADPTVAYGVAPQGLNRPLSHADLKRDTPYNTYLHTGLPPGPICNPGKASLEAAVHPMQSDDLYFVATGHGGHMFAPNAAEHAKNVVKYRAALKAQK